MNTSGSYPKLVGNATQSDASRPRLEDLVKNVIEAEKPEKETSANNFGRSTARLSYSQNDLFTSALPAEIVLQLGLNGADTRSIFERLKAFQQENRHKPILEGADRIVYVDYDLEIDRIRLFVGFRSKFRSFQKILSHGNGFLLIEQAIELTQTQESRAFFGLSKRASNIAVRLRLGSEFLSARENCEMQFLPILSFIFYAARGHGVSSCCIKADQLPVG